MKRFINSTLLVLCIITAAFGQEKTAMSADQSLRSNARVNPSTLGMELSIPLGGYPGRGLSVPINLSYSSKVWRMKEIGNVAVQHATDCWSVGQPIFAEESASGWTTGMAVPYVEYAGYDNLYDEHGFPIDTANGACIGSTYSYINYVRRITVHLPGGETHELRVDDTIKSYLSSDTTSNPDHVDNQWNWNATYYAVDGSNLKYVENSSAGTYRLYMPNGSYFDFAGSRSTLFTGDERTIRKAVTQKDVTGQNTITYYGPNSSHPNGYQTDTFGRTIDNPVGFQAPSSPTSASTPITYSIPGFGGTSTIDYKLHWKALKGSSSAESALTNYSDTLCYPGDIYPDSNQTPLPGGACKLFSPHGKGYVSAPTAEFNPIVLTKIELPNGTSYQFGYDIYGRINKITYPAGAIETFSYAVMPSYNPPFQPANDIYSQVNFGVSQRNVYESSGATAATWTYGSSYDTNTPYPQIIRTVAPDGTKNDRYTLRGYLNAKGDTVGKYGYDTPLAGMPIEERAYTSGTDTLVSRKVTSWSTTSLTISGAIYGVNVNAEWHPRVTKEESIVYDISTGGSLSASATTDYASVTQRSDAVNPTAVKQYGFTTTLGSLGSLQKSIETTYKTDQSFIDTNQRSKPDVITTNDASGNPAAKSQIFYDDSGYGISGVYGLPTRTRSWYDITNNYYIETKAKYDSYGNVTENTDGRGNVSTTTYDSTYHAFPTSSASPVPSDGTYGSNTAFTTSSTFDATTGLPTSTTDINGQTTQISYADPVTSVVDPLLRVRKVTAPNGQQTITEYGAGTSASTRYTKVSSQIDALSWKQGYSYYDGLGRTFLTQSVDDVGDEFVMSCFDTAGRPLKSTNPFRGFTTQTCSTTSGLDWTTKGYDTAGRPSTVTAPDGSVATTAYSLATSGTPIGAVTTVTDQAGKLRRSVTNAFGQLARVDEPDTSSSTGSLGAVSSPNQYTTYVYDPLNNLTTVNQGSQTRTFSYDALSRLKSATNPEMGTTATNGTITYQYDANGNLTQKVDPRTITTTYAYDNLNRVKTRTYSDSTLGVSYYYDNLTNAKGKLIKVTNGTGANTSTTEYTAFDILGRVTAAKQTTDGGDAAGYNTAYTYNLAGALINETYPSGRVVQNVLDTNGDLSVVKSSKNAASGFWNYASGFKYTAAGAVSDLKLGNGKWESTVFNNRLQPTQIALGTTQGGTDKLKLNFSYGSTDNNGNVQSQTITVPTVGSNTGFTAVQTYAYDSLNRLGSATEMEGSTQTWKQAFTYDRYGNRNFNESQTTMPASFSNPAVSDPSVSASNNRLTATGYTYDNAGNTTRDGAYQTYTYDAENKQTEVKNSSSVSLGQYWYDGDGKRVKKYVPATGETTVFVYDAAGKQIAEYSTIVASSTDAKVNYLTSDHLGSPRINTDANGAIISRHDYHPFGEEIDGTGGRTIGLNYGDNSVRKQFTGYEFDGETGLDFAGARMYIGVVGRYTTPDPLSSTQRGSAPQTFNRYTYVLNNPLSFVDITGAFPEFAVSVYVRAFAPFAWFGPGNIAKGDNRGFSTDLNASYRIQATSEVTIADDGGYRYYPMHTTYAAPPTTSTTRFDHFIDGLPMEWQAESPTSVSDIGYSHGGADGTTSLSFSEFGNDKAIPGSSNIDLHSNFDFSYQDLGGGSVNMTVTGSVTGDQFPAAEAFIQDKKGNSVMLGVFAPKVGDSPVTKLPGDHKLPMINANVTIVVKSGIFQGILENGKVVSLADYNKRFTGQDAVQPVD